MALKINPRQPRAYLFISAGGLGRAPTEACYSFWPLSMVNLLQILSAQFQTLGQFFRHYVRADVVNFRSEFWLGLAQAIFFSGAG